MRLPELLDELNVAKGTSTFKKTVDTYRKMDLLIPDEWLIRTLYSMESYNLLKIIKARANSQQGGSMIFCTQYETSDWYGRLDPASVEDSPISEAIMDQIIHNAYSIFIDGKISMRNVMASRQRTKRGDLK